MNTSFCKPRGARLTAGCLGAIVLICASVATPREAVAQKLLRWKLQPGEALRVQFSQQMGLETTLRDQPVQTTADMSMLMKWQVQRVLPGGVMETKQTIERVRMSMDSPGTPSVKYDSGTPPEPDDAVAKSLADTIQPLIGVEFVQQMDPRGEVVDVRLTEAGRRKLEAAPGAADLNTMFSQQGLQSLLSQTATVLPEEPVKAGQQWTGVSEAKSPIGTLTMSNTYTYRGTEVRDGRPLERIDVAMQVTFDKTENANATALDVSVTEQQNVGTMYFDAEAGRFVDSVLHQKMTLATEIGQETYQQRLDTKLRLALRPLTATAKPKGAATTR